MEKLQFINSGVLGSVSLKAIDALAPEAEVSFAKLTEAVPVPTSWDGWILPPARPIRLSTTSWPLPHSCAATAT